MKISENPSFENRYDAGVKLAEKLREYKDKDIIVLAIPNGGVQVAVPVALALNADMDFVICRKLPIPLRPEGGFGAVADDGSYILYPEMVKSFGITDEQIDQQVLKVRGDVKERIYRFRAGRPISLLTGRTVIVVDDGLASGYTMLAAIESLRRKRPKEIIVAAPTASAPAVKLLEKSADKVVSVVTEYTPSFYVSKYYRYWHNMEDDETLRAIEEFHRKRGFMQLNSPCSGASASITPLQAAPQNKIPPRQTIFGRIKEEQKNAPQVKRSVRSYNTDDLTERYREKKHDTDFSLEEKQRRYNEAKRRYIEKTLFKDE